MRSILRLNRRSGSVGLILIGATVAVSLALMFSAMFLPSNQPKRIAARAATVTTLYPVADTTLKKNNPNDNFGNVSPLSCQGSDHRLAYIKFDLSSFANQKIISAKLQLKVEDGSDNNHYIEHVKSSDWQENTVTYNTVYSGTNIDLKPSAIIATINDGESDTLLEIPVTQIVSQESGKILTLACVPQNISDSDAIYFFSREAATGKPALVIESEPLPTPTASSGGFGGITLGQTVSGIIYVTLYTDQVFTDYVKFYIDNTFINEEHVYPYSLGGDTNGSVNGYDTRQLSNGQHILKAEIYYKDGSFENYQVTFNVLNNPTATPTCIPLPSCAWPGANPVCTIASPPAGGNYCSAPITPTPTFICPMPTLPYCPNGSIVPGSPNDSGCATFICAPHTPTPTCTPRPACLDSVPQCLPPEPVGGWCPATPTPTATPTPSSCSNLVPPSGLTPEGVTPAGGTQFIWLSQTTALKYALRIDDLADDFNFSYVNGKCIAANTNDVCIDDLNSPSYPFTLKAGHTYRWWVHAINSCNNWSSAASVQIVVPQPTPTPTATHTPTPTSTPSLTPTLMPAGITVITPVNGQVIEGNVVMVRYSRSGDLNNIGNVRLKLDNGSEIIDTDNDGLYTFGDIQPGTHTLNIYLTDTQGNPLASPDANKTISFSVTELPTPTSPSTNCALKPRGDADCDGKIDMIDYEIWREEFIGSAATKNADFDSNSKVNLVDYETWRREFVAGF